MQLIKPILNPLLQFSNLLFNLRFFTFISLAAFFAGCAQINELQGGEKDIYAPTIDSAKTFPLNGQTNFNGEKIHLKFNEYVALNKPTDNIIITPTPIVKPEITCHNKTVEIVFMENLQPNTTYTVSFNGAITDITEKNDSIFQYVFSTGDYIDSLSLKGKITDAYTNLGVEGFLVALYPENFDVQFDSIPLKIKPTYIAQTDISGNYQFNYLKEGNYHLFAFYDKNKNMLLNEGESIAFNDSSILEIKSPFNFKNLKSSDYQNGKCKISKVDFVEPGKITVNLTAIADSFDIYSLSPLIPQSTNQEDSLIFWLTQKPNSRIEFYTYLNGELDTIKPIYKTDASKNILNFTTNLEGGKLVPNQKIALNFNQPIDTTYFQSKSIAITSLPDSNKIFSKFHFTDLFTMEIDVPSTNKFFISIDSGFVKSIYDNYLTTNKTIQVEKLDESYFGSIKLIIDTTFAESCFVRILNDKKIMVGQYNFNQTIEMDSLIPGNYQLQLIFDSNNDGEWTAGSLPEKKQPENVIYYEGTINVKSKWSKEIEWNFKTKL